MLNGSVSAAAAAAAMQAGKVLSQVGSQSVDVMELLVGRISLSTTGRVMFGYDAFDCTDLSRPCDFWRVRSFCNGGEKPFFKRVFTRLAAT
jgi:hypothetical protein